MKMFWIKNYSWTHKNKFFIEKMIGKDSILEALKIQIPLMKLIRTNKKFLKEINTLGKN